MWQCVHNTYAEFQPQGVKNSPNPNCWIVHYLHLRGQYLYNESFCHFSSIHPRILLAATSLPADTGCCYLLSDFRIFPTSQLKDCLESSSALAISDIWLLLNLMRLPKQMQRTDFGFLESSQCRQLCLHIEALSPLSSLSSAFLLNRDTGPEPCFYSSNFSEMINTG